MAKKKPEDLDPKPGDDTLAGADGDGIERAGDGADAPLAEDERAELDRLRALLAAKAPPAAGPAPALPRWVGTIKYGVDIVVEAPDAVHAEQEYKRAAGIIRSEHPVEISPAPAGAELGHVGGR
jgi:hypothetical protein